MPIATLLVLAAPFFPSQEPQALAPERMARALESPFREVVLDASAVPGRVFARGADWKAEFGPDGLAYTPVLGLAAETNQTTSFELVSAARGARELPLARGAASAEGATVTLPRGSLREVYHLEAETIEQTFVLDEAHGEGDLVLELDVTSPWEAVPGEDALRFVDPRFGDVSYGRAFAVDATGWTREIPRTWTGDGIELRVPSSWLDAARWPITVDPVISSTLTLFAPGTAGRIPDVAYDSLENRFLICWEDSVSAADGDIWLTEYFPGSETQGSTDAIDMSQADTRSPAIATAGALGQALVVFTTYAQGSSDIEGRFVFPVINPVGMSITFAVESLGTPCSHPDVGGTWATTGQPEFCVVWQSEFGPTDHDIVAQRFNAGSTSPAGSPIYVQALASRSDVAPAISKSWGDPSLAGAGWNVAWIHDDDLNGVGTPHARRILPGGALSAGGEFQVSGALQARHVDVTSSFDDELGLTGERPFLVAYQRTSHGGEVHVTVCTDGAGHGDTSIGLREDFDRSLAQIEPSIATDGRSFLLTYSEEKWSAQGTGDHDTYMATGGISALGSGGFVALAERHLVLSRSTSDERAPVVTTRFDGEGVTHNGLAAWIDRSGPAGGALEVARVRAASDSTGLFPPVGRQYCEANAHGDSGSGGRESSWISLFGTQAVGDTHRLECNDMKVDAFAYFICSDTTANVNMPGNSLGRLCLGGSIGRVVGGSILFSGPSGAVEATFTPTTLPSPTGPVSASGGETWYFQCWHRDSQSGAATSNFSNACAVTFRN